MTVIRRQLQHGRAGEGGKVIEKGWGLGEALLQFSRRQSKRKVLASPQSAVVFLKLMFGIQIGHIANTKASFSPDRRYDIAPLRPFVSAIPWRSSA